MAHGYNFYAVAKGFYPGVYETWDEAWREIKGFPGAIYQGFDSYDEAVAFVQCGGAWSRQGWERLRAGQALTSDPPDLADIQRLMDRNGTFYAVAVGRRPGVYLTWDEARVQVLNYPGAKYRGFKTFDEADAFVECGDASSRQACSDLHQGSITFRQGVLILQRE